MSPAPSQYTQGNYANFSSMLASPPTASNEPPEWAKLLIRRIEIMDNKLGKLDSIEKTISTMYSRVEGVEGMVRHLEDTSKSIEESVEFMNKKHNDMKTRLTTITNEMKEMKKEVLTMTKRTTPQGIETELSELKTKLIDNQARTMRDNLVFSGIEETADVLLDLFKTKLKIEKTINLERVHRMGRPNAQRQRPRLIVAKFENFKDRETVRKSAYGNLTGTNIYINEQLPREIEEKRKLLYPIRREAIRASDKARISVDKLYINSELYVHGKPVPRSRSEILRAPHRLEDIRKARAEQGATSVPTTAAPTEEMESTTEQT